MVRSKLREEVIDVKKSEELVKVAETLAQLSMRLSYWNEFELAYQTRNLADEITLLAGGLRIEEAGEVELDLEEVEEA